MKKTKLPKHPDMNQLAYAIVQAATSEEQEDATVEPESDKNPHAVALGRLGGLKGGKARKEALTPERRKEIAQAAAKKRWEKK
jgi:hypothetical protein